MTPQVITETLFCLQKYENITISDLRIVTTEVGKNIIVNGDPAQGIGTLIGALEEYSKRFRALSFSFNPESDILMADDESQYIPDPTVREEAYNSHSSFPSVVLKEIRLSTGEAGTVLHCSLAGGRKTMSATMATVMSLFARKDDTLTHILVHPEFEKSKKFFPTSTKESKQLRLVHYPFIRLRGKVDLVRNYQDLTFTELTKMSQQVIDHIDAPPLILNSKKLNVKVGEHEVMLTPKQFAVYMYYAKQKEWILGGKAAPDSMREEIQKYVKEKNRKEIWTKSDTPDFFNTEVLKVLSEIKLKFRKEFRGLVSPDLYIVCPEKRGGTKYYGIEIPSSKRQIDNKPIRRRKQ
jgi:CRISPR-associated protein (TIGR02584 family)